MKPKVFWLFCTVIDNFGDIGVSWRLAAELRARLNAEVWLWLDDLAALKQLLPDAPDALPAAHQGIRLRHWQEGRHADLTDAAPPDVVIETFACTLPDNVLHTIRRCRPLWLNWEYLSAEDWAERSHAMRSLQSDGSVKYFWQMGFTPQSGGLLREAAYPQQRQAFERTFRQPETDAALHLYAFGYASPVWADWYDTWQQSGRPLTLHLAGNQILHSLQHAAKLPQPFNGHLSGSLNSRTAPFVPQPQFDCQLWAADLLLIRGEDSFVRAQYAAKPFFWHIYPQAQHAHLDKLDAFWQLYWTTVAAPAALQHAHTALSLELNGGHTLTATERADHWHTLWQHLPQWQQAAAHWQEHLFAQSDTVSRLQHFMQQPDTPQAALFQAA